MLKHVETSQLVQAEFLGISHLRGILQCRSGTSNLSNVSQFVLRDIQAPSFLIFLWGSIISFIFYSFLSHLMRNGRSSTLAAVQVLILLRFGPVVRASLL